MKFAYESGQTLQQHEGWLSAVGVAPSNTWKPSTSGCNRRRKTRSARLNPADLMTKHLDGKRLTTLCELLNVKHISGIPNSVPKLAIDTEYVARQRA